MNKRKQYRSRRQIFAVSVICLSFFIGCEFEPHLLYHTGAEEPEPLPPEMILNFEDTLITIYEKTTFTYSIDPKDRNFLLIEVYLNQQIIHENEESDGSFTVNPYIGSYDLTIKVYTSSGSGSILDNLGGEGYVYSYTARLVKKIPPDEPVNIISAEDEDGTLIITWEKYTGHLFSNYKLYKNADQPESYLVATFTDINDTVFVDQGYVGGSVNYFIVIQRSDYRSIRSENVLVTDFPELTFSIDKYFNLTVSWSKCNYDANFKNYVLTRIDRVSNYWRSTDIFTSDEINDTTTYLPYGLDTLTTFKITFNSIVQNKDHGFCSLKKTYKLGLLVDDEEFYTISQSAFEPFWLYTEDLKINPVTLELFPYAPPEKFGSALSVTQNNKLVVVGRNLLDPINMSKLKKLNNLTTDDTYPYGDSRVSVSVKNIVLYEFQGGFRCSLYDIKNDSLIRNFSHWVLRKPTISPNGKYFVAKSSDLDEMYIYEIKESSNILVKTINGTSENFVFVNDTLQSQFIAINEDNLELWSCDTRSLIANTSTEADHVLEIDPVSNTLLCSGAMENGVGHFFIYRINPSFELLNSFRSADFRWEPYYYRDLVSYLNSTIFVGGRSGTYAFNINY